jgi:hypothetical protein
VLEQGILSSRLLGCYAGLFIVGLDYLTQLVDEEGASISSVLFNDVLLINLIRDQGIP